MKILTNILPFFFYLFLGSCSGDEKPNVLPINQNPPTETSKTYKYLALGDSYTIGESVCETCNFPQQLKSRLETTIPNSTVNLKIIATTGWTTTNLKNAINVQNPANDFDLVTLLIGVNNQYQHKPFSLYEQEFPELLNKAIALAKGEKGRVIVVSIPDYAYTPFGHESATVSAEIQQYNTYAKNYTETNGVTFVNITDITQQGIDNPNWVAGDGLHPSELAYAQFVERILPKALTILNP